MLGELSAAKGVTRSLRRWWTTTTPTFYIGKPERVSGWHFPLVLVSQEIRDDLSTLVDEVLATHRVVHHCFDSDLYVYAWWPIASLARACYWWRRETHWRYVIERALSRRVIDKMKGEAWSMRSWRVRPLRRWTWRKTRN